MQHLLEDLMQHRTTLAEAMAKGAWTIEAARDLAALQGAIEAIRAEQREGPTKDDA